MNSLFFPIQTFLPNFTAHLYIFKKEIANIILIAVFGSLITNLTLGFLLFYFYNVELSIFECMLLALIIGMSGIGELANKLQSMGVSERFTTLLNG